MATLTFYVLASLIIFGLVAMIFFSPVRWILVGWGLVSLVLALLFFLLNSPLVAALQLLLAACLEGSFILAVNKSPKTKTRPLSASSIVPAILASLVCVALAVILSTRLMSLAHREFPETIQGSQNTLAFAQIFTGQNIVLVFGTALLILSGLVSLTTLTRKEKA